MLAAKLNWSNICKLSLILDIPKQKQLLLRDVQI